MGAKFTQHLPYNENVPHTYGEISMREEHRNAKSKFNKTQRGYATPSVAANRNVREAMGTAARAQRCKIEESCLN